MNCARRPRRCRATKCVSQKPRNLKEGRERRMPASSSASPASWGTGSSAAGGLGDRPSSADGAPAARPSPGREYRALRARPQSGLTSGFCEAPRSAHGVTGAVHLGVSLRPGSSNRPASARKPQPGEYLNRNQRSARGHLLAARREARPPRSPMRSAQGGGQNARSRRGQFRVFEVPGCQRSINAAPGLLVTPGNTAPQP